jgi:surface carbohydrate biosynthesis protein
MKTVDVLYFIEHVPRELDIACIVKYLCETKYGLSVKIASLPLEVNSVIHQYQPHIVVVPYFYSIESSMILPIIKHWENLTYLNLNYEQFFSKVNRKFKAPKDSFARNGVFQHTWSEIFKESLIKDGVKEANIFVNGNPSYMLYLEPYCNYFFTRSDLAKKYKLNEEKRWLFFPENYGWAFLSDAEIESYIREGYDPKIAYENREFNQKSLKEVIHWFNHIAQNTNVEIIVRPRPAVSENEYIKEFEKEPDKIPQSIHIIKEGSIREWNLASDVVVSSFSTSLLEAAIAGKATYMLEPYSFPDWLHGDWYDLIPHIKSLEELESISHQEPDHSSSQRARDYVMQTNLSRGDAIANIARILYDLRQARDSPAKYIQPVQQPPLLRRFLSYAKNKSLGMFRSALNCVLSTTSESETNSKYTRFDDDNFTEGDVNERTKRWEMVLTSYKDEK